MRTGGMERLAWPSIPPQTGVDPPEGAPARESIRLKPGQVSVQHVASHVPLLPLLLLGRWGGSAGKKGGRP